MALLIFSLLVCEGIKGFAERKLLLLLLFFYLKDQKANIYFLQATYSEPADD